MVIGGESSLGSHNHSFHIPNVFSRNDPAQPAAYQALAREEEQDDEPANVDSPRGNHGEARQSGVEDLPSSWMELSNTNKVLVQCSFGMLGAAVLLPFNAIITPSEFYRSLLRNTPYETSCMSWIVVAYNVSCIVFGAHATATMHRKSISRRTISSSTLIILVLLLIVSLSSLTASNETLPPGYILSVIVVLATVVAAATSYLQLAVVTLSNAYGPSCLGTMLAGQGLVGAIVSLVQLITAVSNANSAEVNKASGGEARSAVAFFAANTIFMAIALGCFWKLKQTTLYGEVQARMLNAKHVDVNTESDRATLAGTGSTYGIRRYMNASTEALYDRIVNVQPKALLASLSIAYIFVITLAVFPALTSRVRPQGSDVKQGSTMVFVAWHFLAFNLSDLVGRSMPAILPKIFRITRMGVLSIFCLLRSAFVPLLAMCNLSKVSSSVVGAASAIAPTAPLSSHLFFLLVILLGLSNGLLATNLFIVGPRQPSLSNDAERDLAAGLLSWWLTFGLAIGSFVSFFVGSI